MKFLDFRKVFEKNSIIDITNVVNFFNGIDRRRLYEWQKKEYIKKISNNFYIFIDKQINDNNLRHIANTIYSPSYVGIESALSYYNFIPEAVFQIISITTKRNKRIKTCIGEFKYKAVKKELFFGYNVVETEDGSFFISSPEKTILDMFYFFPYNSSRDAIEQMRFNRDEVAEKINISKMRDYLKIFSSRSLCSSIENFMEILNVKF